MSNPTDVMDDIDVLEKDKCAAETGTKKRKYHQIQTVDDNLPNVHGNIAVPISLTIMK